MDKINAKNGQSRCGGAWLLYFGIYKISILSRVHSVQEKTHLKRLVEEKGKEKEVLKGKEAAEKKTGGTLSAEGERGLGDH